MSPIRTGRSAAWLVLPLMPGQTLWLGITLMLSRQSNGVADFGLLEFSIRDDLDKNAPRAMCVLRPLKLTLSNYPQDKRETLTAAGHPNREEFSERSLPFTREIYIDREDFRVEANKKYKRLKLGGEVRLRNAYVVRADELRYDDSGEIIEIIGSYDPDTLGANPSDGRKVRGVIHWVSATDCVDCAVYLYDRLFTEEVPDSGDRQMLDFLNPDSLRVISGCKIERGMRDAASGSTYQFEREGYFCVDDQLSGPNALVFNRTISLRDSWGKVQAG